MAKKGGRAKETAMSILMIVLIIGAVLAWARVNNINSYSSFSGYFKSWSSSIDDCGYINWISGKCDLKDVSPSGSSNNGGTNGDNQTNSPPTPSITTPGSPLSPDTDNTEKDVLKEKLENLTIKDSDVDAAYDRAEWKHWTGKPCNTRQEVLISQGEEIIIDDAKCKVLSGVWIDPYSLDEFIEPGKLDIDHVIPLSWANRNGGAQWEKDAKEEFANDFDHLLAVSAKENRSKGDKGPGDYMPPNRKYHCDYSKIWIFTLDKYSLSVPQKDYNALERAFATCK